MKNYYSILLIGEDASREEIKQAYHKMARLFHPDNFKGSQEDAENQMALVNEAYQVLSDEKRKREYDYMLHNTNTDRARNESCSNNDNRNKTEENTSNFYETKERRESDEKQACQNSTSVPFDDNGRKEKIKSWISSALSKLIEWAISLVILYLIANHFGLIDKA